MTLDRRFSNRTLATRSLRRASAAVLLSLSALPAAAQNQLWVRQLGTGQSENTHDAAPDASGGLYVSGRTGGSLGGPYAGKGDAWLARYDGAGNQLWVHQLVTF